MSESETWFFIDEPEIGLHPGLQRIFLDVITSEKHVMDKKHRFFLTTHSNHLLDLTLEKKAISIFSISRRVKDGKPIFVVRNSSNDRLRALTELGALNSSVLMANCSIWVEGVTDRIYVRKFLKVYCEENGLPAFQEDIHYAFFEYSGGNITHYLWHSTEADEEDGGGKRKGVELEKINMQFVANRVFLLADRDSGKDEKHEYWKKQAGKSNGEFLYYVTTGKEIENYLTPDFLTVALSDASFRLSKPSTGETKEPWLSANDIESGLASAAHQEYCDVSIDIGLAKYLVDKLGLKSGSMQPKNSTTGTFSTENKKKLADLVDRKLTKDNIGEPAKELAKSVYEFIKKHNPSVHCGPPKPAKES